MDRFGTRIGYAAAVVLWSLAGMATALANSALGFGLARAALGPGRGGELPRGDQDGRRMVPQARARPRHRHLQRRLERRRDRGAGRRAGDLPRASAGGPPSCSPARSASCGSPSGWWKYRRPEEHPQLKGAELAHIQSDPPDPPAAKVPWIQLIPRRQTCAFAIGKYLTDPIWWFYLYWIPSFSARSTISTCWRSACR